MKSALAFQPFYLSCAQEPQPMIPIVDIEFSKKMSVEKEISNQPVEPSIKEIVSKLQGHFNQILRERQQSSLEGTISLANSNDSFEYHYDTAHFCNFDTKKAYPGRLVLLYHSFPSWKEQHFFSNITFTDVAPFGSVERVQVFVDKENRVAPLQADYAPRKQVQKFYSSLLRELEHKLTEYQKKHSTFKDFDIQLICVLIIGAGNCKIFALVCAERNQPVAEQHDFLYLQILGLAQQIQKERHQ